MSKKIQSDTSTPKKQARHLRTTLRRNGVRLSPEERVKAQEIFLKTFASNGNVRIACHEAGIDRSTVYQWAEHDADFSILYNQAKEDVNDAIRAEIYRRGMFGEERFVTSMGKVVYHDGKPLTIREKSDTLLIFHAKARMPEYRDKSQVEHSGAIDITGTKERLLARLTSVPEPAAESGIEEHRA